MLNRPAARAPNIAPWLSPRASFGAAHLHLLAATLLGVLLFPWPHRADLPAAEGKSPHDLKSIETPEVLLGRALARPARLEFIETPLNDVIEFLKDEHQIPITVDKRALEDDGVDTATPVTMNVAGVTLKSGLEMLLEPLDLTWVIRKEVLTITTVVQAESWLETRIYDVRDLLLSEGESFVDESSYDYRSLIAVLSASIPENPNGDMENPQQNSLVPFHGMLVASLPQASLRKIEEMLAQLRHVRRQQQLQLGARPVGVAAQDPWLVRVYRLPATLGGSCLMVDPATNPRQLDPHAPKAPNPGEGIEGIAREAHARAQARYGAELAELIPLVIAPEGWKKDEGAQIRQTPGSLVIKQRLSVHRQIKRLIDDVNSAGWLDTNQMLESVTSFGGGGFFQVPAQAAPAPPAAAPAVLAPVAAPGAPQPDVNGAVKAALDATRDLQGEPRRQVDGPQTGQPPSAPAAELSPRRKAEAALRQALARPATLEALETPLEDVLAFLSKRYAVPIVLDYPSLENDGIDPTSPVTLSVANVRLSNLIDLAIGGLSCRWLVRDQAIVVTSDSMAQTTLIARAHAVDDLLVRDGEFPDPANPDVTSLVRLLRGAVAPQSWHPRGGMANLAVVDGVLLVSQSHAAHEEIDRLLAELSRRQRARPRPTRAPDPDALSVRIYNLASLDHSGMMLEMAASPGVILNGLGWGDDPPPEGVPSDSQREKALRLDAARYTRLVDRRMEFARPLAAALPHVVAPSGWRSAGDAGTVAGLPGVLIVRQTSAVHAQLRTMFKKWERDLNPFAGEQVVGAGFFFQIPPKPEAGKDPAGPVAVPVVQDAPPKPNPEPAAASPSTPPAKPTPGDLRIKALLEAKATLKVEDSSLEDFFASLEKEHRLPLKLDQQAIQEDGVSLDVRVSVDLADTAWESILEQVLEPLGLDWCIRDETLWITSSYSPKLLTRKLYPVRDLVLDDPKRDVAAESSPLAQLVQASIARSSWQEFGGRATLKGLGDVLVVSQTRRGHEQITKFLEDLRRARRQLPGKYDVPAEDPLLAKNVKIDVKGMPLSRAVARLAEAAGVPVTLDRKGFETAGLDPDQSVTMRVADLEFRSVLNLMLEPLGLAWQLKGKGILISPRMLAPLQTRIYNVRHLLRAQPDGRDYQYATVIDALRATVAGGEWEQDGGEGSLAGFQGLLVVTHNPRVQTEIRELLEDIAQLANRQRADAGLPAPAVRPLEAGPRAAGADEAGLTVVLYPLMRDVEAEGTQVQNLLNQLQQQLQGQAPPDAKTAVGLVEQLLKALEIEQQRSHGEAERLAKTARTLVEVLPASVLPKSWKGAGGSAQVHALPDAIVVRQDAEGHAQVRAVLEKMGFHPVNAEMIGPLPR